MFIGERKTERSVENFKLQDINKMPKEIIHAFAYLKKRQQLPTTKQKF